MHALSERLRLLNSGRQRPQPMRTLTDFVQKDWEPVVLPTLKYVTQKHYKYILKAHLIPAFGEFRLPDISPEAIQNFLLTKLREDYSWESVHHFRCALSKVLGSVEEWNYLADNPVRKTRLPRREYKQERPILAPAQVWRLMIALPEPARSVAMLLVLTGLRIGELLALRWKSVDLGAQTLRVTATVYEGHFDTPKTRRSARTIPLGPKALSILSVLHKRAHDPGAFRVSPCAAGISCIVICSLRAKSSVCQEWLGIPCVIVTLRCWTLQERR